MSRWETIEPRPQPSSEFRLRETPEVHPLKLQTDALDMHVSIGKTRHSDPADGDSARVLGRESLHFGARADCDDSAAKRRQRFGLRMRAIQRDEFTDEYRIGRLRCDWNCGCD